LSVNVIINTTMDISIVNVNGNIEDEILVSSSTNSHNIVQCDVYTHTLDNLFLIRHFVMSVPIMILEIL